MWLIWHYPGEFLKWLTSIVNIFPQSRDFSSVEIMYCEMSKTTSKRRSCHPPHLIPKTFVFFYYKYQYIGPYYMMLFIFPHGDVIFWWFFQWYFWDGHPRNWNFHMVTWLHSKLCTVIHLPDLTCQVLLIFCEGKFHPSSFTWSNLIRCIK